MQCCWGHDNADHLLRDGRVDPHEDNEILADPILVIDMVADSILGEDHGDEHPPFGIVVCLYIQCVRNERLDVDDVHGPDDCGEHWRRHQDKGGRGFGGEVVTS